MVASKYTLSVCLSVSLPNDGVSNLGLSFHFHYPQIFCLKYFIFLNFLFFIFLIFVFYLIFLKFSFYFLVSCFCPSISSIFILLFLFPSSFFLTCFLMSSFPLLSHPSPFLISLLLVFFSFFYLLPFLLAFSQTESRDEPISLLKLRQFNFTNDSDLDKVYK